MYEGQRFRFTFSILSGVIQTFFLNSKSTNKRDCKIGFNECWSWGLTINQYYGVLFCIVAILSIPVFFLKEPDAKHIPRHTFMEFLQDLWLTLKNLTTFNLMVFVIGSQALTNFASNVNVFLQYYIIGLTSFQVKISFFCAYTFLVFHLHW